MKELLTNAVVLVIVLHLESDTFVVQSPTIQSAYAAFVCPHLTASPHLTVRWGIPNAEFLIRQSALTHQMKRWGQRSFSFLFFASIAKCSILALHSPRIHSQNSNQWKTWWLSVVHSRDKGQTSYINPQQTPTLMVKPSWGWTRRQPSYLVIVVGEDATWVRSMTRARGITLNY